MILSLLSKLKLQHIVIILLITSVLANVKIWDKYTFEKSEKVRQKDNYENMRDIDSLQTAMLQLNSNYEIKEYVKTNKKLEEMLDKQDISIRKLNKIIYQKQRYIDNIPKKTDVSEIVEKIREDIPVIAKWQDSTECLVIKGNVEYKNDSLSVNVNSREFNNDILITSSWERNQRNIWTKWFGRKKPKVTATSTCGDSKTVVIERK